MRWGRARMEGEEQSACAARRGRKGAGLRAWAMHLDAWQGQAGQGTRRRLGRGTATRASACPWRPQEAAALQDALACAAQHLAFSSAAGATAQEDGRWGPRARP
jgi:hypothetical protein